jgi:hypothetical protein
MTMTGEKLPMGQAAHWVEDVPAAMAKYFPPSQLVHVVVPVEPA